VIFSLALFGLAANSWTGPSSYPPNGNTAAPINTSATSQIKSGALQVNGLHNIGSTQFDGNLGIGTPVNSSWRIAAQNGTYGIYADASDGQAIRGAIRSGGTGYAGYFDSTGGSNAGGVFARNSSGYYAYLGYPGSIWSVYSNGPTYTASYSRADGGFCIGGSCVTAWGAYGPYWVGGHYGGWGGAAYTTECPSGYVMVGLNLRSGQYIDAASIRCRRMAN